MIPPEIEIVLLKTVELLNAAASARSEYVGNENCTKKVANVAATPIPIAQARNDWSFVIVTTFV